MARKKNNPLGGFADALDDLGLGGTSGTEEVTNIDDQENILDDPNVDDLDKEKDRPDDDNIDHTEDDKSNDQVDPKAKEDDSEIPDDVLNNKSSDNNDDAKDEQDPEEKNEDDEEDEEEIDPAESKQIGVFFDAFAEAANWDVDEKDKPTSVEELVKYMEEVVDQNSKPTYADERIEQLDQYVKNGGRFEDFYQDQQKGLTYESIDLEDETNQKTAVRDYYKLQGLTDDQISRKIERYEDADMLEDEATDAVEYLKKYQSARLEEAKAQQEAQRQAYAQQTEKFMTDLNQSIGSLDNIRGISVPKEDRKALLDYITKTDAEGLTQYQKDFNNNLVSNLLESAYFTMKGDALLGEAKRSGQTSAASKLRTMLKNQSRNHSSQNPSNNKQPQAWDIASKYLY